MGALITRIMNEYEPNGTISIIDRDSPWINNKIKTLIQEKKSSL